MNSEWVRAVMIYFFTICRWLERWWIWYWLASGPKMRKSEENWSMFTMVFYFVFNFKYLVVCSGFVCIQYFYDCCVYISLDCKFVFFKHYIITYNIYFVYIYCILNFNGWFWNLFFVFKKKMLIEYGSSFTNCYVIYLGAMDSITAERPLLSKDQFPSTFLFLKGS